MLEQYPSFTADINIDDNKKNNKFRVRREMSDKGTTQKLLHPRKA